MICVSNKTNFSFKSCSSFQQIANAVGSTEKTISSLYYVANDTVSLNSFVGDKEETELGDFVADPHQSTER